MIGRHLDAFRLEERLPALDQIRLAYRPFLVPAIQRLAMGKGGGRKQRPECRFQDPHAAYRRAHEAIPCACSQA